MGSSRDGVGSFRLNRYLRQINASPFNEQPYMFLDPDLLKEENSDILRALWDGILILNDALPPEFQLALGDVRASDRAGRVGTAGEPGNACGDRRRMRRNGGRLCCKVLSRGRRSYTSQTTSTCQSINSRAR